MALTCGGRQHFIKFLVYSKCDIAFRVEFCGLLAVVILLLVGSPSPHAVLGSPVPATASSVASNSKTCPDHISGVNTYFTLLSEVCEKLSLLDLCSVVSSIGLFWKFSCNNHIFLFQARTELVGAIKKVASTLEDIPTLAINCVVLKTLSKRLKAPMLHLRTQYRQRLRIDNSTRIKRASDHLGKQSFS